MLINNGTVNVDERFISGEDALVIINAGTVTSGQRLLMDLGGHFVQNGGSVSVAATFAMADGSLVNNSGYTLNAGTLNVTGEFALECEAGNFQPFFTQNGGTLTVNGDIFWLGTAPGSGQGRITMNGGSAVVSGMVQNMPLSTMNMRLAIHNASTLTLNGNLLEGFLVGDSILQSGTSTITFNAAGNFNNPGVLLSTGGNAVIAANTNLAGTGFFQWHNLEIEAGATLNHSTTSVQHISGDLTHNGVYQSNLFEINFNGSASQQLNGATNAVFHHVTLEHTGTGVQINVPSTMNGNLVLNSGIMFTSAANPFVLTANATSTGGNPASFVNGPMTKIGSANFVFPLGKNGRWARLGKSNSSLNSDVYVAEYFDQSFTSISPVNSPLTAVSNLEYWVLDRINGTSQINATLYWEDAAASAISDCNDVTTARWNGASWDFVSSTSSGSCTANGSGNLVNLTGLDDPGALTFGFFTGVTTQNISICSGEQVVVGSSVYQSAGSYIDYLLDVNMNDSIVITNLSVITPNATVQLNGTSLEAVVQGASAYNWLDCASNYAPVGVNTFDFTPAQSGEFALEIMEGGCLDTSMCIIYSIQNEVLCAGESITMGSGTYSTAGTYSEWLTTPGGADSVVVLNLSITTVDVAVTVTGATLSSSNVNASNFQWIDCTTGPIAGTNSNSYLPAVDGNYALIVTENGCVDTSACYFISFASIAENAFAESTLYPNPSSGHVTLNWTGDTPLHVYLYDATGQAVLEVTPDAGSQTISWELPAGYYFVHVESASKMSIFPLSVIGSN